MILLLCISYYGSAQKLENLSLEDAVLQRFAKLRPQGLTDAQWVTGSQQLSYLLEDRQLLLMTWPGTKRADIRLELREVNENLDIDMKAFPRLSWLNPNVFYFHYKNAYYQFDMKNRKGEKVLSHPEGIVNLDYHGESKHLAYTKGHNLYIATPSSTQVTVTRNDSEEIVSGQAIARYEFGIGKGTFWSPAGAQLAFYQKDESEVTDYPILEIQETPAALRTIKYPMAGQKSEKAKVGVYDVESEKVLFLNTTGEADQYLTNLAWSQDGQHIYLAVVNRNQDHMKLNKYKASDGSFIKTLWEERNEKWVEPEKPVWMHPSLPDDLFWLSERDGFMHIYQYNTDGKLIKQVTKGDWVVKDILGFSKSGNNLIVTGTDESGLNVYAYSINVKNGKKKQLSDNSGTHSYKMSEDGILLLDSYSSLKTPMVVDLINTRGKKINTLSSALDPLRDYKVGNIEFHTLKSADGHELHARLIKPSNFDPAKKYPTLVYVYGGPHAQMVRNTYLGGAPHWMLFAAEQGYLVWTLDNRGSANRGFGFESVIHRQLGTLEIEDQMVGINWLKKQPYVNPDKMAVHGWSYGGFMTVSLMLRQPDVFKVGVAGGPVTDWKYYEVMYGERYMDKPQENEGGYERARLMTHADKLKGDLLLIHGTEDDVVVMQHNMALVDAFVKNGKLIDFMPYPGHPHNVRGKDRVHLISKVLDYIGDHLD